MERTAPKQPSLPSVVQVDDDGVNWWNPCRSDIDAEDYASGVATFEEAQQLAAEHLAFGLLCSFVLGMREPAAFELGFLDAMAAAAVDFSASCLYTAEHIAEQSMLSAGTLPIEAVRAGNENAWSDRKRAAQIGTGHIARQLLKFVMVHPDPSLAAYLHSLSIAATRQAITDN